MKSYLPVPVEEARRIAIGYEKTIVVILAYDPESKLTHTTTYGVQAFDKENAAAVGEICTKAIGGDLGRRHEFEDFHRDYKPAFFRALVEGLDQSVTDLVNIINLTDSPHVVEIANHIIERHGALLGKVRAK